MRILLLRNRLKKSLKTVTMITKILTCYISVTVPDRHIVTIIHRQELTYRLSFRTMTCDLRWPWRSQMVTFMNFKKNAFSQSVFELEASSKNWNNDQQYANSMAPFARSSDALPVTWRHKRYFRKNWNNSFIF